MVHQTAKGPADYILPLYMNGLSGRVMRLPAPARKKREILIIPGMHTSLERMFGLAEYLNQFGGVTVPDLPGFGGMEPLYKIGEKVTLDSLADYLAAFIKLRYRNRRLTILGISLGFSIATRMLQKYPEIAKKVDLLISFVGFVNKEDFRWKKRNIALMKNGARVFTHRLPASFGQRMALRAPFIRTAYGLVESKHPKFKNLAGQQDRENRINFEITLWQINDIRTYMACTVEMFNMDLCNSHVDLPVYHVAVKDDHYFDNVVVEQHMRTIYNDFNLILTKLPVHAPTVVATKKDMEAFVPPKIRQMLRKKVQ